jgi:hypothetical protein
MDEPALRQTRERIADLRLTARGFLADPQLVSDWYAVLAIA